MRFTTTHPMDASSPLFDRDAVRDLATAAERAGFDGYGFTDHPAPSQKWLDGGGHDALDPFAALAFVAGVTETIRLIPNIVVLAYRNPFITAKAGATVDVLSGGRFTLAVGAGYLRSEFGALGVDHDTRNDRMDEALEAVHAVWTGDAVEYEGSDFHARGVTAHPRPVQDPRPPIWIGGNGPRARQRVVDHGDGWCPFPAPAALAGSARTTALETLDDFAIALDDLWERVDAAGRDRSEIDVVWNCRAGGDPASDDFDPDAHLEGLGHLEELGVTWVQVGVPHDVARAADTYVRYGEQVIGPHRAG